MHSPFACSIWRGPFFLLLCVSSTCTSYSPVNDNDSGFDLESSVTQFDRQGGYGLPYGEQIPLSFSFRQDGLPDEEASSVSSIDRILSTMLDAIDVMQSHYFAIWQGNWPTAIDWTAAVMGTQISATLSSISETLTYLRLETLRSVDEGFDSVAGALEVTAERQENLINQYFTQITSFYFGENAFSLRTQAYDDMLWVVLGWLESVKFIELHSRLHYHASSTSKERQGQSSTSHSRHSHWYARQFIPQFSHRARIFYNLASKGWDTSLCGGGMVWNPYLAPYKNAITNQLYIAASVSMYLYFPGDENSSPFSFKASEADDDTERLDTLPPGKAHDEHYLTAAITTYDWLKHSNMTNAQGLYVDGFHINGWRGGNNASRGTGNCDVRDNKVYTYNQGVILSGLRGLFDATGNIDYLYDAHELISNVIAATGWKSRNNPIQRKHWAGLGRGGVMEESCDSSGTCSQNGHAFKGIFFHHLALLCTPLARKLHDERNEDISQQLPRRASKEIASLHAQSCKGYGPWIEWNARAAYATRNQNGEYGTWWGSHDEDGEDNDDDEAVTKGGPQGDGDAGTDYRNNGVPDDEIWRIESLLNAEAIDETNFEDSGGASGSGHYTDKARKTYTFADQKDVNDRGRGRTVETQSGGLAIIRALWDWRTWYRF